MASSHGGMTVGTFRSFQARPSGLLQEDHRTSAAPLQRRR
jgi:hypothetical protein